MCLLINSGRETFAESNFEVKYSSLCRGFSTLGSLLPKPFPQVVRVESLLHLRGVFHLKSIITSSPHNDFLCFRCSRIHLLQSLLRISRRISRHILQRLLILQLIMLCIKRIHLILPVIIFSEQPKDTPYAEASNTKFNK